MLGDRVPVQAWNIRPVTLEMPPFVVDLPTGPWGKQNLLERYRNRLPPAETPAF